MFTFELSFVHIHTALRPIFTFRETDGKKFIIIYALKMVSALMKAEGV